MRVLLLSALLAGAAGECLAPTKEMVKGTSDYCCSKYCCSKKVGDPDCDCDSGGGMQCATTRGGVSTTTVKAEEITVSGGSFNFPYYTFEHDGVKYDGVNGEVVLEVGKTYTFVDGGVSRSHPFRITGEDGGLPITITLDEANSAPEYYCKTHSSMKATFMIYMDLKVHGGNKAFTVDEFLSSKVKDLKKECKAAEEDGGRGGKWLGSKKEGNCFYETWCEQFSKDKKGCKKAKVGAKKVCKYKKERKAITSGCAPPVKKKFCKEARDAKCAIKKK